MSISIEKRNYDRRDEFRRTIDLKDTLKPEGKVFVCEPDVKLWIKRNQKKGQTK